MHSIQSRTDSSGTLPRYRAAFREGVAKCTLPKAALTAEARCRVLSAIVTCP